MMTLTLSGGFVVDDAIVMFENVVRHMELGKTPLQAALDGSKEIGFTILSMTVSLVAVFIPVLFMGGLVGRLLNEFSITIALAILVSGFISLTLTPMMCSRFLHAPSEEKHGRLYLNTERAFEATLAVDEIIQELRRKFARVAGLRVYLQNPPPIRIGGQVSKSQYQYTLQSPDTGALYQSAPVLAEAINKLPGFQDVTTDLQLKNPQIQVTVDRENAAALGVTPQQVESALGHCFGSQQISTIYSPNNAYQVILELSPEFQTDPSWLSQVYVRANSGRLVPLTAVAEIGQDVGPLTVNHAGQLPAVTGS